LRVAFSGKIDQSLGDDLAAAIALGHKNGSLR
jgi:hypothetical protein